MKEMQDTNLNRMAICSRVASTLIVTKNMNKIVICFMLLFACTSIASASVTGTPPNLSGDADIHNDTTWSDETYTLHGNVTVHAGGNLTVDNTTLIFASTSTDSYGIFIGKGNATTNGGRLAIISGSNITAENPDYNTWVYAEYEYPPSSESPIIRASDSYFSELGNVSVGRKGLEIRHTTSETFFDNITIHNSVYGIYLGDGGESINITDCTITDTAKAAIYTKWVGAYICNNNITGMQFGVYAQYTDGLQIIDNTFDAQDHIQNYVIDIMGNPYLWSKMDRNFLIRNNTIKNFQRGVVCNNGVRDGIIENNTVMDSVGVAFGINDGVCNKNTNITIRNNVMTDIQDGIIVKGRNHTVYNNEITNPLLPTGYTAGIRSDNLYNTTIYDINIINVDQTSTVGAIFENSLDISLTNVVIDNFKYGLKLSNVSDTRFIDLNISGSTTYSIDFRGSNANITFVNPLLNDTKINFIDGNDMFLPYYYLDVEVVDSSGSPIRNAAVTIVNDVDCNYPSINVNGENKTSFTTGADGHTSPSPDPANSAAMMDFWQTKTEKREMGYTVTAEKGGYSNSTKVNPDSSWYRSDPNTYQNTVIIVLPITIDAGNISGKVTDSSSGAPIKDARVEAGAWYTTTDENGEYTLSTIYRGTYTVTASATGYENASWGDITVSANNTTIVNFQLMNDFGSNTLHIPGDITASPGNSVTVPIMLHDATGVACTGVKLTYDASVVAVTSAAAGDFTTFFGFDDEHAADGWVTLNTYLSGTQLTGDVAVAYVTLVAVGNAGDTSPLDMEILAMADQNGYPVAGTVENGLFTVVVDNSPPLVTNPSASQSIPEDTDGVPSWGETAVLSVTVTDESDIASVTIDLSAIGGSPVQPMTPIGGNVWSVTTNASAGTLPQTYALNVRATDIYGYTNMSESVQLVVMRNGDVTGDGDVTPEDVTLLDNYAAHQGQYTISSDFVADVSGDGMVNIADAMLLANYVTCQDKPVLR